MYISCTDSSFSVVQELEKFAEVVTHQCESLRTSVVNNPEFLRYYEPELVLPDLSVKEAIVLSALLGMKRSFCWYYINHSLINKFSKKYQVDSRELSEQEVLLFDCISLFESSVYSIKSWFIEQSIYNSPQELFSIINNTVKHILPKLRWKRRSNKVRKPQRKRGYDDKGSLRPSHKWKPSHDYSLVLLQNEIEENRQKREDSLSTLLGYFYPEPGDRILSSPNSKLKFKED